MAEDRAGRRRRIVVVAAVAVALAIAAAPAGLAALGRLLVAEDAPARADAVVVLHSGARVYERLAEAAALYNAGHAPRVVINGDRTSPALRALRSRGLRHPSPWDAEPLAVLEFLGVPPRDVVRIAAETAFDTLSEARAVVPVLRRHGIDEIVIVTSRAHTRRARHIWRRAFPDAAAIRMVAARDDPFDPDAWWREGRQVHWVLNELGGWLFYLWERVAEGGERD